MRGIYCITNTVNGKIYIGQSSNLQKRKRQHFNALRKNTHGNKYLQHSFNKYGEKSFDYQVMTEGDFTDAELNELECMYIQLFGAHAYTQGNGYNLAFGGNTKRGFKHTLETRKKMSESRMGEKNGFYGKKHTEETKKKIVANTDYSLFQTSEYRQKMSEAMTGRVFTEQHRQNKSNAQRGGRNPIARKVSIEGVIYDCIQDAANHYGLLHNTTSFRIKSTSETFREWFYLDDLNA